VIRAAVPVSPSLLMRPRTAAVIRGSADLAEGRRMPSGTVPEVMRTTGLEQNSRRRGKSITRAAGRETMVEFSRAGAIDPVGRANTRWLSRYRHQR
jgi:hypothetical protein